MPARDLPTLLAELAKHPSRAATVGLVTDFDGTLAPIVDDPATSRPLPDAVAALRVLVHRLALVGVVSGRTIEFLRTHLPIDGIALAGQYGAERLVGGEVVIDARLGPFLDGVAAAADEAKRRWPELLIERKGGLAVTIHWRTAPEYAPRRVDLDALAARHELSVHPARMACELRPPIPVDKGTALETMLADARLASVATFAGDDSGDLAAFDALDRMEVRSDHNKVGIRIAVRSSEAPPELLDRADIVVDGPAGFAALLAELAAVVSRPA